jgi:hypothetical protein
MNFFRKLGQVPSEKLILCQVFNGYAHSFDGNLLIPAIAKDLLKPVVSHA